MTSYSSQGLTAERVLVNMDTTTCGSAPEGQGSQPDAPGDCPRE